MATESHRPARVLRVARMLISATLTQGWGPTCFATPTGSNAILFRDTLPREGDHRAMPQDFTVRLTDPQVEALQKLATSSRQNPDDALHRVIQERIGKLMPSISKPIRKDRLETFIDGV